MNPKCITRSYYNEKIHEQNEFDFPKNYEVLFDELDADHILIFERGFEEIKLISAHRADNGTFLGVKHKNHVEDEINWDELK